MAIELQLLSPWILPFSPEGLARELKLEVGSGHPLYSKSIRALAVARDRDDVLFEIGEGVGIQWAVVHLTWSGKTESSPSCPRI